MLQGLVPTSLTRATAAGGPSFSVGAMADSYYEYLLKLWLLGGQKASAPESVALTQSHPSFLSLLVVSFD